MSQPKTKAERLEELLGMEWVDSEQRIELEQLKKELNFPEEREGEEPIESIQHNRQQFNEDREKEQEYALLKAERRKLEVRAGILREKKRIEALRNELDGKVYCDDCNMWVEPSHFENN